MGKELTLTVPRRHILAAMLAVSTEESRPVLNHIAFQSAPNGGLRIVATSGYELVAMTGGKAEGTWPRDGANRRSVLLAPDALPKKRTLRLLDKPVTIVVNGTARVVDPHTDFESETEPCPGPYPKWEKVMGGMKHPVAKEPLRINAAKLNGFLTMGERFAPRKRNHAVDVTFRQRDAKDEYCMVTMEATREDWNAGEEHQTCTLQAMLMGLRKH